VKEVTTFMKKTALQIAVLSVLGMMVSNGPALAGTINTNTSTLGSQTFGFAPSGDTLMHFTRQTGTTPSGGAVNTYCVVTAGVCVATPQPVVGGGLATLGPNSYSGSNYVPIANSLPGALTSRPDKVVSTWTDFGCGDGVPTGATCVEGPPSTGINTLSRVIAVDGHNTAPLPSTCSTPPCAADGTLTGALHSEVALENLGTPDMPSGSIVFDWTPGVTPGPIPTAAANNGTATYTVDISHEVNGLYVFNEFDTTVDPILTYASRDFELRADAGETAGENFPEVYPTMDEINVLTTLSLTQNTMGGNGFNTEDLGYSVRWGGTIGHPGGGVYFTPGLNIRDWNGNTGPTPTPNAPGDGMGFAN
jgi:hypothetical protein